MMTNNSYDIIALTMQVAMPAFTLTSLPAAKWLFLLPLLSLSLNHFTWWRYAFLPVPY